jgi:SAM-dependent methyltransferase
VAADESPVAFYDGLAADYDALYDDWWTAAKWHARIVDKVLQKAGASPGARLLDCACGIGTQALGLARRGYDVTGTDLSDASVARARREADAREIALELAVADMRSVDTVVSGPFDVVIACDNAIPHLLDDADLDRALGAIGRMLASGGVFLASVRDYDALRAEHPTGVPAVVREREGKRTIIGQGWEWDEDDERIRINLFVLTEHSPGEWQAEVHTTWYRALTRATFTAALDRAGFTNVRWHEPDDSAYYQPIVTASR